MDFEFATTARIVFGRGKLREIGVLAKALGKRALIVTGRNPRRAEPLLEFVRKAGIETGVFSVSGEPEITTIQRGTAFARQERCDMVIALGGGSALDSGKAIAAMLANSGDLLDYLEVIGLGRQLNQPSVPFIAIPTTAGTGSEATRNAVLSSPEHRIKVSLRSHYLLPRIALVDPELTDDLPPAVTASTGLDALTQLLEPYVCSRTNPITDRLCLEGMQRSSRALRAAFEMGDKSARDDMAIASLFGGMALANAGLGAVHGLAGPIGGMFPAPHGAVCAALLPLATQTNFQALRERHPAHEALIRYEHAARLLTGQQKATADDGAEWLRDLVSDLKIPGLRSYGVKREDIGELVAKAQHASSMKTNPIVLTREELESIVECAL